MYKGRTIGVINQKGGSGKTTTSIGLADSLVNLSNRVLLVDTDRKGTALKWAGTRGLRGVDGQSLAHLTPLDPRFAVVGMTHAAIHKELPPIAVDYDYTIIDGFPKMDDIARSAIMASDLILIPVQPSPYDIWAAEETVKLVTDTQIYKPMLKCAFVIERKITNTTLGREVAIALEKYNMPVFDSAIYQRVMYAECGVEGMTLSEADNGGVATQEMAAVANEVFEFMGWK